MIEVKTPDLSLKNTSSSLKRIFAIALRTRDSSIAILVKMSDTYEPTFKFLPLLHVRMRKTFAEHCLFPHEKKRAPAAQSSEIQMFCCALWTELMIAKEDPDISSDSAEEFLPKISWTTWPNRYTVVSPPKHPNYFELLSFFRLL